MVWFTTQREMPVVQNQSELKVIYKSQSKSDKKVILFADTFNINFEVKNVLYAIRILEQIWIPGNYSKF